MMNWCSKKEHFPKIKRKIQVIKEIICAFYAKLSYTKKLPKQVIIGLVYEVTKWLNLFPVSNSVSDLYSPRTIFTGRKLDWQKDCKIEFGQSVQVHNHPDRLILNAVNNPRTTGGIAIWSFGNLQGGYKFLSLETG